MKGTSQVNQQKSLLKKNLKYGLNYCCQWQPQLRARPHEQGLSGSKTFTNSSLYNLVILVFKSFDAKKVTGIK